MVNVKVGFGERSGMAHSQLRVRRVIAAAALAAPALAALVAPGATANATTGECLAWFGSRGDGICMGYSNGSGTTIGTPDLGIYGPGYGLGVTSGPLLPGQTISQGISP